jgi:hypothetical protein
MEKDKFIMKNLVALLKQSFMILFHFKNNSNFEQTIFSSFIVFTF